MKTFANNLFAAMDHASNFSDRFGEEIQEILGLTVPHEWPFDDYHFDSYDSSFELDSCRADFKLTPEQQKKFWELGFWRCWLNYPDGTERHYWKGNTCHESQGRLKRKSDSSYLEPPLDIKEEKGK
jgi:hypothetical protein